jgi:hypothetical protein
MKIALIVLSALSLTACDSRLTPGLNSPQTKLDRGVTACRQGKQFLYMSGGGANGSWVQLINDDGKPEHC